MGSRLCTRISTRPPILSACPSRSTAGRGQPGCRNMDPVTNRDPSRLTIVAMTGVTALVRATAFTMEQRGVKYPGKDVRDWLRDADITHISNEVPFARDCRTEPGPTRYALLQRPALH